VLNVKYTKVKHKKEKKSLLPLFYVENTQLANAFNIFIGRCFAKGRLKHSNLDAGKDFDLSSEVHACMHSKFMGTDMDR